MLGTEDQGLVSKAQRQSDRLEKKVVSAVVGAELGDVRLAGSCLIRCENKAQSDVSNRRRMEPGSPWAYVVNRSLGCIYMRIL